ncbi:MAG: pyridoxamine 5'-phosphate oxidase [Actinomycetota bacterium]
MSDFEELSESLAHLGVKRSPDGLDESDLDPDPFVQFGRWMSDALEAGLRMPNEMTLATADDDCRPSARIVLLKGVDERGFTFFTNFNSRKGRQMAGNPQAALVFYWAELERQVNVTGPVERVSSGESEAYWVTRPPGSRRAAWASNQSEVIQNRAELEARVAEIERRWPDDDIPLPPHWGGFRLAPETIEFWQGRPNRLHDRLVYRRVPDVGWLIERLAP